jgi:Zn-dependent protease
VAARAARIHAGDPPRPRSPDPAEEGALAIVGRLEQKIVDFVIQLAVILFAISFHESAHAWMALRWGDTTARDQGRISLNPIRHIDLFGSILLPLLLYFTSGLLFGYARPTPVDLRNTRDPRRANLAVSAAGPLSNFLLCAVGIVILVLLRRLGAGTAMSQDVLEPLWAVAASFVMVNFSLGFFNFLPIPPLDGSHVVESVVGPPAERFFQTIAPFGFLLLIALSYIGVLGRVMGPVFEMFRGFLNRVLA